MFCPLSSLRNRYVKLINEVPKNNSSVANLGREVSSSFMWNEDFGWAVLYPHFHDAYS